jgi:hypothetical protein
LGGIAGIIQPITSLEIRVRLLVLGTSPTISFVMRGGTAVESGA